MSQPRNSDRLTLSCDYLAQTEQSRSSPIEQISACRITPPIYLAQVFLIVGLESCGAHLKQPQNHECPLGATFLPLRLKVDNSRCYHTCATRYRVVESTSRCMTAHPGSALRGVTGGSRLLSSWLAASRGSRVMSMSLRLQWFSSTAWTSQGATST